MFGPSPANLDWLCSFYHFEKKKTQNPHMVKVHISLRRRNTGSDGLFADANVIWFMRRGAKIDLRVTIRDGQRFHIKMCARILNLVPDSEPGEAGVLPACRLVVISQVVIKSGLTFGLLYLEQLALPFYHGRCCN